MSKQQKSKKRGCLGWTLRIALTLAAIILIVLGGAFLIYFRTALYNNLYLFPQRIGAWEQIRAQHQSVTLDDGWNEYRGVLHSHSELSHDSMVSFPEIVEAMKTAECTFICMTDHYEDGKADYSLGWNGMHDGILFVRGYELDHGLMPWGIPEGTVFSKDEDPTELAKKIREMGAVLFYSHTEKERNWDLPELQGMEIYNIHTDMLDENLGDLAPEIALGILFYPEQTVRLLFDPQTPILERWDDLNRTRHITGIAANDCHQNVGVRAVYTSGDALQLLSTADDDVMAELNLNFLTRPLLRMCFGNFQAGEQVFRLDLDKYERMSHYINTHLLMKDLTEESILDALRQGRAYVAFNMIADAEGFVFLAENEGQQAVMGESIPYAPGVQLKAESPVPCTFILKRHGEKVAEETGRTFEYAVPQPGKYRLEAHLDILGEMTPWVYTNPIDVTAEAEVSQTDESSQ